MSNSLLRMYARYSNTLRSARIAKSEQLKKIVDEDDDKVKSTQNTPRTRRIFFPQKSDAAPSFRERMSVWWQSLFTPKKD